MALSTDVNKTWFLPVVIEPESSLHCLGKECKYTFHMARILGIQAIDEEL